MKPSVRSTRARASARRVLAVLVVASAAVATACALATWQVSAASTRIILMSEALGATGLNFITTVALMFSTRSSWRIVLPALSVIVAYFVWETIIEKGSYRAPQEHHVNLVSAPARRVTTA